MQDFERISPRKSKYIPIKIVDLIDFALLLLESGVDMSILDFFMDFFPEEITNEDIRDYFQSLFFLSQDQVIELGKKSELVKLFSQKLLK